MQGKTARNTCISNDELAITSAGKERNVNKAKRDNSDGKQMSKTRQTARCCHPSLGVVPWRLNACKMDGEIMSVLRGICSLAIINIHRHVALEKRRWVCAKARTNLSPPSRASISLSPFIAQ